MTAHGEVAASMTSEEFRRMPVPQMIEWIGQNGDVPDPRTDIDTASLVRRFPHLAAVQMVDVTVEGASGTLRGRTYRNPGISSGGRGLVWAHGGAFLGGSLDVPEAHWFALEQASRGVPVLSIDYTKCVNGIHYPVPSDDVLTWWSEVVRNAPDWLGVSRGDLLIGGASAGATLTASAVQRMINAGDAVPAGLVLVYPALHPDSTDPSVVVPAAPHLLGLSMNYAGSEAALSDPSAFPGLGSGAGFPPSFIVACELDAFLASAQRFHETLTASGVTSSLRIELDAGHGHIDEPSEASAHRTVEAVYDWISRG